MAISPQDEFPGQTVSGDPGYPHGKARNISVPGDGTGTPWEERVTNDIFGFQQALLDAAGIEPNGVPDSVTTSQYLEALETIVSRASTYATMANWHPIVTKDFNGDPLTVTSFQGRPYWSTFHLTWLIGGHTTDGSFYHGDHDVFVAVATGVATPPSCDLFVETADGRVLIFSQEASEPDYIRSGTNTLASWTKLTLPGPVAQVNAVKRLSTGRIVVFGQSTVFMSMWYSDDNGLTFTAVSTGGADTSWDHVMVGEDDLIVALGETNTIWYSTDLGLTWTQRLGHGLDGWVDVAYLSGSGIYVIATHGGATGSTLQWMTEPIAGAITEVAIGVQPLAISGVDKSLLVSVVVPLGATYPALYFIGDITGPSSPAILHRGPGGSAYYAIEGSTDRQFCALGLGIHTSLKRP